MTITVNYTVDSLGPPFYLTQADVVALFYLTESTPSRCAAKDYMLSAHPSETLEKLEQVIELSVTNMFWLRLSSDEHRFVRDTAQQPRQHTLDEVDMIVLRHMLRTSAPAKITALKYLRVRHSLSLSAASRLMDAIEQSAEL